MNGEQSSVACKFNSKCSWYGVDDVRTECTLFFSFFPNNINEYIYLLRPIVCIAIVILHYWWILGCKQLSIEIYPFIKCCLHCYSVCVCTSCSSTSRITIGFVLVLNFINSYVQTAFLMLKRFLQLYFGGDAMTMAMTIRRGKFDWHRITPTNRLTRCQELPLVLAIQLELAHFLGAHNLQWQRLRLLQAFCAGCPLQKVHKHTVHKGTHYTLIACFMFNWMLFWRALAICLLFFRPIRFSPWMRSALRIDILFVGISIYGMWMYSQ